MQFSLFLPWLELHIVYIYMFNIAIKRIATAQIIIVSIIDLIIIICIMRSLQQLWVHSLIHTLHGHGHGHGGPHVSRIGVNAHTHARV